MQHSVSDSCMIICNCDRLKSLHFAIVKLMYIRLEAFVPVGTPLASTKSEILKVCDLTRCVLIKLVYDKLLCFRNKRLSF